MKNILILGLLIISQMVIGQNNDIATDTTIFWQEDKQLQWDDYKGQPPKGEYFKAYTAYKIEVVPENLVVDPHDVVQNLEKLTVVAKFFKKQSWTAVAHDTEVLNHERLHFDITELYARKIRKKFKQLKADGYKQFNDFYYAYQKLWKELRKYQSQYDLETDHGRDLELNQEWEGRVRVALDGLKEFSNSK